MTPTSYASTFLLKSELGNAQASRIHNRSSDSPFTNSTPVHTSPAGAAGTRDASRASTSCSS
jgi:hypothetical protein